MGDPDRRISGIHALATGSGRTEGVNPQVRILDLDVHLVHFGKDRHRRGGGVNAARSLGSWDALDAMSAALKPKLSKGAFAGDHEDDFLKSAYFRGTGIKQLHFHPGPLD